MYKYQSMQYQEASEIIKAASDLSGLNQENFALLLGRSQSSISRYCRKKVNPPSDVIMHCMHILNNNDLSTRVEMLSKKLKKLSFDDANRSLIAGIEDIVEAYLIQADKGDEGCK